MNKTANSAEFNRIAVNADTLAKMLDCGRTTAVQIGTDAGARIQLGRRILFNVKAVESYIDRLTGHNSDEEAHA